jgi:hypothetical protein
MTVQRHWINYQDGIATLIASAAYVSDGATAPVVYGATFLGEADCPPVVWGFLLDITVQGGTQTSVDLDIEGGYGGVYTRLVRYNSVPADGVVSQLLLPNPGSTKPLPIGAVGALVPPPGTIRLRRTFNTPGGTPTITLTVYGVGWGYRNNRGGWPGMR